MKNPGASALGPAVTQPLLIGCSEVARLTSLSPRSIWRLASAGQIPLPLRVGARRLWRRSEIVSWIEAGCPKAAG